MDNHYHLLIETPRTKPVLQGTIERSWDRLVAGLVLGSVAFALRLHAVFFKLSMMCLTPWARKQKQAIWI
jgi:hypothetical protein